ncbi:helix-turn-helix transcriptional regulator [Acidovorax sp. SUPP2522]|uniref:LexA family transcriptional regulator n=1 Tax=unclassified Acidovorax TaxID=2684926 RepID=UPI00234A0FFA|nr:MULTISPECIES: XRE family transcriptional regulator [unclassified Acidovorax]WCM96255.1 helix-turn-helix transcriptional regulator [Acidovorax sp. GBBC 1281]GKT20051.1 helix-turn-helix transcriptional regulator [Acidovorax sp. SUPP2522]
MTTLQSRLAEMFPDPKPRGLQAQIQRLCGVSAASVSNWFSNPEKVTTISRENAEKLVAEFRLSVSPAWLAEGKLPKTSADGPSPPLAPAPHEAPSDELGEPTDLVITEYATGCGMGTRGQLLLEEQPGIIKSWRVTQEWLRLNVPNHSGLRNLCIVTGFGPSMRPMFNPGDPLLVDTGVRVVNHEGVYFFRVGDEGFIKMIQRVPEFDGPGFCLRIISKNPDYPPYDISPKNQHFEVLGKVLTVWRSEQY